MFKGLDHHGVLVDGSHITGRGSVEGDPVEGEGEEEVTTVRAATAIAKGDSNHHLGSILHSTAPLLQVTAKQLQAFLYFAANKCRPFNIQHCPSLGKRKLPKGENVEHAQFHKSCYVAWYTSSNVIARQKRRRCSKNICPP